MGVAGGRRADAFRARAGDDVSVARVEVALPDRAYPVVVGAGVLADLVAHVSPPDGAGTALVVTQAPVVAAGHVTPVEAALAARGLRVHRHVVPDGEAAKDVTVLTELWDTCGQLPLGRGDLVVAVGGGVVGDLGGFLAATWNRGVAVLQVPTTLLAQVDAAIGGKTGINTPAGKNLVGAFHQPVGVVCDVATLATLPTRVAVEGLGEVVKYGLIRDPAILALLEEDPGAAVAGHPPLLRELVERSVRVKADVVAADEREGGVRAHLNLGHTYGHAVESLTGYASVLHGEAVAIGTVVALHLGVALDRTPPELVDRTVTLLDRLGLPTRSPALDRDVVWQAIGRDKKATRDGVRWIVLDDLAVPAVVTPSRDEVDAVLDRLAS
ncbi:3-dehydroquinate synthase [Nitriliruptoraceae bacterium ZYF776]|nr:3-dehydroquinate synthase [Profundirhabdus halotolerans]